MTQNRSHAVMAQRAEPHDSLDDFPTQPWGTRALIMKLRERLMFGPFGSCWEPAANRGFMVRPLREDFETVIATDVHDYGCGFPTRDFLFPGIKVEVDWIITNPPFRLGKEFALTALARCSVGCALLVRTAFLEGGDRFRTLFSTNRPNYVFQFVERLPMVKGRCDRNASTATSYAWLVWLKESPASDTVFDWIQPCRAKLERASDYEPRAA